MPPLATPRPGGALHILGLPVHFSYWPMYRTTRRYGLQAHVYVTNPWALIRSAVQRYCSASARAEALAYVQQAEFFYGSATASVEWAAKPLLLYYSFLNLAKAYVLSRGVRQTLDQARHGVSEKLRAGRKELLDAYLDIYPSSDPARPNVLADFWQALSGHQLTASMQLDLPFLLPQVLAGHRLWCDATRQTERFMGIENIQLLHDTAAKQLWAVIRLHAGTLSKHGITQARLLRDCQLRGVFRPVRGFKDNSNEPMLQFEQISPTTYTHRPSDKVPAVIDTFRHRLWAAATTTRPFREYYLYVAPAQERSQVLPQLVSLYATAFYLGSITRYRPQHFDQILNLKFGALIQEFLTSQPTQFVYLLASEFARREVTRPALA